MNQARVAAGAVILAAGLSSRFGGRPKALAELGGRSLLRGAAYKCRLVGVDRVTVVTGHHKTEVEEAAEALGLTTVHNPDFRQGMFSSIQAGVRAMAGLEAFFVWPVDGALTRPQTLLALITAWRSYPDFEKPAVMVPVYNFFTGHPPLINGRLRQEIMAWTGGGLRGWMGSLMDGQSAEALFEGRRPDNPGDQVVCLSLPDEGILSDITPEDLAGAREAETHTRPGLNEAWTWLLQHLLSPEKISHCQLVAAGAFRLATALNRAGFKVDPDLALLGGLLHDVAHGLKEHDRQGRLMAEGMGWPEIGEIMGAHTEPPPEMLQIVFEGDPGGPSVDRTNDYLAGLYRACLSVYLADKLSLGDGPASLETRFEATRRRHCSMTGRL